MTNWTDSGASGDWRVLADKPFYRGSACYVSPLHQTVINHIGYVGLPRLTQDRFPTVTFDGRSRR